MADLVLGPKLPSGGTHNACWISRPSPLSNAYERFRLGKPAEIRALQDQLRELLQSGGVSVPQSGQFDAATRDAIKAAERSFGLPETGTVTPALADNLAI